MDIDKENEIQDMVLKAEAVMAAKEEVEAELTKEEQMESGNTSIWIKIRNVFCRTVKTIVTVVIKAIKSEVLFIINNADNQRLAKVAVLTAIKLGLKSSAAWAAAWTVITAGEIVLSNGSKVKAADIRTNILETLLQLVYCCISNKDENTCVLKNA